MHHETFNHVWTCPSRYSYMRTLIHESQMYLLQRLKENKALGCDDILPFDHYDFWQLPLTADVAHNNFSFIDLIKGVIPFNLSQLVLQYTENPLIALDVTADFLNFIFEDARNNIWIPRCERFQNECARLGITKEMKRSKCPRALLPVPRPATSSTFISSWSQRVRDFIEHGASLPVPFRFIRNLAVTVSNMLSKKFDLVLFLFISIDFNLDSELTSQVTFM